jgi:hypothetical protein
MNENDKKRTNQMKEWVWISKNRIESQQNIDEARKYFIGRFCAFCKSFLSLQLGLRNGNHSIFVLYQNRFTELPMHLIIPNKTFKELNEKKGN